MKTLFYTIHKEDIISRIYGLFPYITFDNNECVLHRATDNKDGCYNKIVENIILPENYSFNIEDNEINLHKGSSYSYKELMSYYYKLNNNKNNFIDFINRGIGKECISTEDFPRDVYPLVPEYIYLAHSQELYSQMLILKKTYDIYQNSLEQGMKKDAHLCCLCDKYEKMGGDKMVIFLENCINKAQEIADEFFNYCKIGNLSISFNIVLCSKIKDIGLMSIYEDNWQAGEKYKKGDIVIYDNNTYICNKDNFGKWDDEIEQIVFPYEYFSLIKDEQTHEDVHINGYTDSKLCNLKRYKEYIEPSGITYTPDFGKDWLFYYKIGMVCNYSTLNDDLGNIAFYSKKTDEEKMNLVGKMCEDLYAYGDVITNIYIDKEKLKDNIYNIVFEYYIGAHLKAVCNKVKEDEDGNILYYFDDFIFDENDIYHGIKHIDIYTFERDSDITRDFCNVTLDKDDNIISINGVNEEALHEYLTNIFDSNNKKYEFNTIDNTQVYNKKINNETAIVSLINSQFEATNNMQNEYQYNKLIRNDNYIGIAYEPKKDIDIYINRGNAAAMEKHIKLGEVKTLDDILSYGNGSFFKIENETD